MLLFNDCVVALDVAKSHLLVQLCLYHLYTNSPVERGLLVDCYWLLCVGGGGFDMS